MRPTRPDKNPNAILFAGGSALGLGAAEGVVRWHVERGMGYQTPIRPIPLVPTSILFDLFFNKGAVIPSAEMATQRAKTPLSTTWRRAMSVQAPARPSANGTDFPAQ